MIDTIYTNPDFLAHHGIKGQKWGVENGPPYPLGRDRGSHRSRAEISKNHASRGYTARRDSTIKKDGGERHHRNLSNSYSNRSNTNSKSNISSANNKIRNRSELSDDAKRKIKIGVSIAAAAAATGAAIYLAKSGKFSQLNAAGRTAVNSILAKETAALPNQSVKLLTAGEKISVKTENLLASHGVKMIQNGSEKIDDTLYWVNKNARGMTQGRHHNCISVAFATEARLRGYDVVAREMGPEGYKLSEVFSVFGRTKKTTATTAAELERELLSGGNGSRGVLLGFFTDKNEGAHALNYMVRDGKVELLDGQFGARYTDFNKIFNDQNTLYTLNKTQLLRTDNLDLKPDNIMKFVEPNDGGHYTFSNKTWLRWLEEGLPESATVTSPNGRVAIRRNYLYAKGNL